MKQLWFIMYTSTTSCKHVFNKTVYGQNLNVKPDGDQQLMMSVASDGNAIYSEVSGGAEAKFAMETNTCYAGIKSASNVTKVTFSEYSWKKRRFFLLFWLVLMLLLATVAACITLGVEISKLKSETASLKSELSKQSQNYSALLSIMPELSTSNDNFNASLFQLNTSLVDQIQQLSTSISKINNSLATNSANFAVASCAALPPPPPLATTGSLPPMALLCVCTVT